MPRGSTAARDARAIIRAHSALAERALYGVLLAVLEAGLVRTMDEALGVLQRAGQPLGPRGEEWLRRQDRALGDEAPERL